MRKELRLTVTLSTMDGIPGEPVRIVQAFKRIKKLLSDGARSGSFTEEYYYSMGGESNRDIATIDFEVALVDENSSKGPNDAD
jgi:hypothetical protein